MAKKRPSKNEMELGAIAYITALMALDSVETDSEDWQTRVAASKDILGSVLKGVLNDYVKYFGADEAKKRFSYVQDPA